MRVKAKDTIESVCGSIITEGTEGVVLEHNKKMKSMSDRFEMLDTIEAGIVAVLWDGESYGSIFDSFHNIVTCTH